MEQIIKKKVQDSIDVFQKMIDDAELLKATASVAKECIKSLRGGGKILFAGNGGSAADAQHLAAELVSRFAYDRPGLCSFALSTDTSVLTAIGNDYGFENAFKRQIEAVGQSGDVFFGISTSGKSPNILKAISTAKEKGLVTVGLTGKQEAPLSSLADYCLEVPCSVTAKIQEGHICLGHIICGLIEAEIFPR